MLLDAGADINSQDWMGRTPLHWAAKEGSIDAVQMLLDHKANTTIKNKEGHLYSDLVRKFKGICYIPALTEKTFLLCETAILYPCNNS